MAKGSRSFDDYLASQKASELCFACDRPMASKYLVTCIDEQTVFVGSECFKKIRLAGVHGWQPPKGGPRLFTIQSKSACA